MPTLQLRWSLPLSRPPVVPVVVDIPSAPEWGMPITSVHLIDLEIGGGRRSLFTMGTPNPQHCSDDVDAHG